MLKQNVVLPSINNFRTNEKENQTSQKRKNVSPLEQPAKKQKTILESQLSTSEIEALAAHKQALKEYAEGVSRTRVGFFYARAPKSPVKPVPTKYAVVATGPIDQDQFQQDLQKTGKFRPYEVIENSPGGGVSKVKSPGGTKMGLSINLSVLRIMSSEESKQLDLSVSSKTACSPQRLSKTQSLRFDPKAPKAYTRRKRTQFAVMGSRAIEEAARANIITEQEKMEWLHLICYCMKGEAAQIKENLVAGTYHANTLMIPVESHLPLLRKYFGSNVSLYVSADLISGTNAAKSINYRIEIQQPADLPPLEIEFKFNALHRRTPSRCVKMAIDIYMQNVFNHAGQSLDKPSVVDLEMYAMELGLQLQKFSALSDEFDSSSSTESDDVSSDSICKKLDFSNMDIEGKENSLFPSIIPFNEMINLTLGM